MRFMLFMIPNLPADAAWTPTPEAVAAMAKYNDELSKAGVLLTLDGLHSPAKAAHVTFSSTGKATVKDGPFAEAKEVIGGYWIIQVKSKEEAVEWARRCPGQDCTIEVRQIFELEDFPPEVQAAAAGQRQA